MQMAGNLGGKTLKQIGQEITDFLIAWEAEQEEGPYVGDATDAVLKRWPELTRDRDNVEQYVINFLYLTDEGAEP